MATKKEPWHPADYSLADAAAIQSLSRGEASPEQQRRALVWIVERACMTYDQSFVPGDAHVTSFIEGRRSAGNQIVKLIKISLDLIKQAEAKKKP